MQLKGLEGMLLRICPEIIEQRLNFLVSGGDESYFVAHSYLYWDNEAHRLLPSLE